MPQPLRLPPVDVYRRPFIEPLGHLALFAALTDNALIDFVAAILPSEQHSHESVADRLRTWNEASRRFVLDAIDSFDAEPDVLNQARRLLESYAGLRLQRHRAIHDAVDVGIFGDAVQGYTGQPLRIGYPKSKGGQSTLTLTVITPESVAELAYAFYELEADLRALLPY